MSWAIFTEEPGVHQISLPYGVIVGIAVEDRFVWQLARKLKDAETHFFGKRLQSFSHHVIIDDFLNVETVRRSEFSPSIELSERFVLTQKYFARKNDAPSLEQTIAAAQSQVAFCKFVIGLLQEFQSRAFAILTPAENSSLTYSNYLRRDYVLFFERVFNFLECQSPNTIGTLVFHPRRHKEDFVSIQIITEYFEKTAEGRLRSQLLCPEPVMAGSSLSTINQAAVLISRILSWGFRLSGMSLPRRYDLDELVRQCNHLRFSFRHACGKKDWSFVFLNSVRSQEE